jgi:predicted AlkP superfamily phosphohydrolase/phosphomutase
LDTANLFPSPILAYIGPGAGFAFLGSFLILLAAVGLALLAILSWPIRLIAGFFLHPTKRRTKTNTRRVVIVGLDGLDPRRCRRLIDEGRLPHMKQLEQQGSFSPLESTCPPISPVAWSSFMTGTNPGKHGIFDFLQRNLRTCLLELSSVRIESSGPGGKARVKLLRKGKPFWHILGEYGIFSTALRVPITYPPERFKGLCLSGMCVPDLRGTQGTFSCFTTAHPGGLPPTGGETQTITFQAGQARAVLKGPPHPRLPNRDLELPFTIQRKDEGRSAVLHIGGQRIELTTGVYSNWISVSFRAGWFRKVNGICRFLLARSSPDFSLYVTPLHIDPARPALPISHPPYYSIYLAKLMGSFATLGLAEDTWALSEGVLDEAAFLEQVWSIHEERERMFFEALRRTRTGACVCVFDASDRIQHMFTRSPPHASPESVESGNRTIDAMYERMDELIGRTQAQLAGQDLLLVVSDHGFTSFRRGVNLNAWLMQHGYLAAQEGHADASYLQSVDWSRTRAYTFGLSGIFLNRKGRELRGIVDGPDIAELKRAITRRLLELTDEEKGTRPIRNVYDPDAVFCGPYAGDGPDLIVGFAEGYRASWDAAVGRTDGPLFSDNEKAWSGDHCVDFALVPGVFFSNRKSTSANGPRLIDIAPTVLKSFGIPPPVTMDGSAIELAERTPL